jgi:adenosine deaminase
MRAVGPPSNDAFDTPTRGVGPDDPPDSVWTMTTRSAESVPSLDQVRRVPKVLLHDHLDGGLRPATIVDLADHIGYDQLPASDTAGLTEWFRGVAGSAGSLERYLEAFDHTVAVMQTEEALVRVARECAEDLAADGVVYAEVRFAPELHTSSLPLPAVVEAVLEGFRQGSAETGLTARVLLTAMRSAARSTEIAELAVRYRDQGVAGFDIAGREAGFPPTRHLDAFQLMQRENGHFTIHAGEGFGLPSIWEALQWCNADRLGHGVRIVDDITVSVDGVAALGKLAGYVRDTRVPLEMCPTSNVNTGVCASVADHPIGLLKELGFRVTVNTDNRLMSDVTLSGELHTVAEAFGYGWDDLRWFTVNAMKSAFLPFDERLVLINDVIKPGFAMVSGE